MGTEACGMVDGHRGPCLCKQCMRWHAPHPDQARLVQLVKNDWTFDLTADDALRSFQTGGVGLYEVLGIVDGGMRVRVHIGDGVRCDVFFEMAEVEEKVAVMKQVREARVEVDEGGEPGCRQAVNASAFGLVRPLALST